MASISLPHGRFWYVLHALNLVSLRCWLRIGCSKHQIKACDSFWFPSSKNCKKAWNVKETFKESHWCQKTAKKSDVFRKGLIIVREQWKKVWGMKWKTWRGGYVGFRFGLWVLPYSHHPTYWEGRQILHQLGHATLLCSNSVGVSNGSWFYEGYNTNIFPVDLKVVSCTFGCSMGMETGSRGSNGNPHSAACCELRISERDVC